MSRVDVVIPCYNYARFLSQCVESVLSQARADVRVLIIDDCSTDETPKVGAALAAADGRVSFRRHAVNHGHIATYNEGLLEWADGDYVLLFSADDVLAPGALARAVEIMERHPEVGMCFGPEVAFSDVLPSLPPADPAKPAFEVIPGQQLIEIAYSAADNPIGPTALVRTSLQRVIGGYRKDMPHTADLAMWLCCAARASVGRVNAVQAFKRDHPSNMIKQYSQSILPDLQQRRHAFEVVIREYASHIYGADRLIGMARTALAGQAFWGAHTLFENGQPDVIDRLLEFAVELDPAWRASAAWRRLEWKRRMGLGIWRLIEPLLKHSRRNSASSL